MSEMDVWMIAVGAGVFVCILGMYKIIGRKRRKKSLEEQINRVKAANEPGFRLWAEDGLETTIRNGVVTYRKRRDGKKKRDYR